MPALQIGVADSVAAASRYDAWHDPCPTGSRSHRGGGARSDGRCAPVYAMKGLARMPSRDDTEDRIDETPPEISDPPRWTPVMRIAPSGKFEGTSQQGIALPKLTSARTFIILPNRLSAALKNRLFSIVRANLIAEEESGWRTPKLGLTGHDRKRLAAECATGPCNILEMADVHHIPPMSPGGAPALAKKNHIPPRCIADLPSRLAGTRAARAEGRPCIPSTE
jgi:hypothetical protein